MVVKNIVIRKPVKQKILNVSYLKSVPENSCKNSRMYDHCQTYT